MKRMLKILGWTLGAIVGLIAVIFAIGSILPQDHEASVTFEVSASAEQVWEMITVVEAYPTWRPDVDRVERRPDVEGMPAWSEIGSSGTLPLRFVQLDEPRHAVARIDSDQLPFGGTWTYVIDSVGGGQSRVTITENGEVYSPIFRFVGRFFIGYDATLNKYRDAMLAAF